MYKSVWLCCLLSLLPLALPAVAASETPTAQAILQAADRVRNPQQPFGLTLDLIEYRDGRQTAASQLRVYARADAEGRFRTLAQFLSPAREQGKLMLKQGNELWYYDPASKVSMRIAPQQRLLGQAANGDVMTANWAQDYQATLEGEDTITDGDRQQRRCHRLQLTASSSEVTYHRITLWTDVRTQQPVRGQFWSESGRLLKTAFYRRYQAQLDGERPTEVVIIDGLNPAWITLMRYHDYAWREVPESWLQRDYLPRFRGQ